MSRLDRHPGRGRERLASVLIGITLLIIGALGVTSCANRASGAAPVAEAPVSGGQPTAAGTGNGTATASSTPTPQTPSEPVREGHDARPDLAFQPAQIVLPGGKSAPVVPAQTSNGVLQIPEHVSTVGWWDGSADVGDPFGNTVIAGHIDSATEGLGFFARLLGLKTGEHVTVRGFATVDPNGSTGRHATYRITSIKVVAKDALTNTSPAFDQTGTPRLVLITCGGAYIPSQGGYQSNVVIFAVPA